MPEATVLIVDDEMGVAKLCERLLRKADFTVYSATDPQDGLGLLKEKEVDLLLVDIRMPRMDGFDMIKLSRRHQPDIGVVIMTGYGTLETAIRALDQGADGLILKPFEESEELVRTVRKAINERQQKQEMARLQTTRPLLDMTQTLFSETRYNALLELILNAICGHLRCAHAAIYHREKDDSLIRLIAVRGNRLPEEEAGPKGGLIARANYWKMPLSVNREGPGDAELQKVLEEHGLRSVVCIPVDRGDRGFVFLAGRDSDEPAFDLADEELFGILARQADIALENARLYGELRAYVKQVEDSQLALIQAEKMAAVGRLTASIAHEVNNPLQAVQNSLHLVGRADLSGEEREDYLKMAEEELQRLMLTVERMLNFYRPGALNRESTDVGKLLQTVLKLLRKQLDEGGVVVHHEVEPGLPGVVVVTNQLQQVFFNLILNALEVMPEGGILTIAAKMHKGNVEITFQDSGPGIPMEERAHIFEPFVTTRENGTGLGLSVSYGILTAHGGSLDLIEGNGRGACFRVRLPVEEKTA